MFGFILLLFLFLVGIVISVILSVIKKFLQLSTLREKENNDRGESSSYRSTNNDPYEEGPISEHRKVFRKDEGVYVDFEEIVVEEQEKK